MPGPRTAPNFAGQVGKCLTEWTGDRWVVSIARTLDDATTHTTLAEQDKAADAARRATALAHPIIAATLRVFPGATLASVKERALVTASTENETDDTTTMDDDQ